MAVKLQFHRLEGLAKFKALLHTNNIELNAYEVTITCDCSEEEIRQAVIHCGAKEVKPIAHKTENEASLSFR